MDVVKPGDKVQVHYTTYAANDCVIETSDNRDPFEFVVGSSDVISGVNRAIVGMQMNERRRIAIAPEQAFGFRDAGLQKLAPRSGQFEKFEEGDQLAVEMNGVKIDVWVRSITDDQISLDANHPLAGEPLIYEIEIVQIQPSR